MERGGGVDYLSDERKKAEFDVEAMKIFWASSIHHFQLAHRMATIVATHQVFSKDNRAIMGRKELFNNSLRKAAHAWKLVNHLNLKEEEEGLLRMFIDEPSFMDVHWDMFIPALKGQCSEEQLKKWVPMAKRMEIIGCYAQTELGHGSNVRGIETTATFDPETDEFIINTPTLTSHKWWPGGMAKVATHGIVYARLIVDARDHGVHGFIVQLRSLDDHSPLPGITLGDIGIKFGNGAYNAMDNGFLRFHHVRIPRDQMLMRVVEVTREGKVVESGVPPHLSYGAMVYVRQILVKKPQIICLEQFVLPLGIVLFVDSLVLSMTDLRLRIVAEWLKGFYHQLMERFKANDFSGLPEAHACTAGLKSLTSSVAADGIEECRKLCGGHGYLCSSGLPELVAVYVPNCTFEGDNVVLLLQVAKFLMKTVGQLGCGRKPTGTIAYMGRAKQLMQSCCRVHKAEDWSGSDVVIEVFEARALRMIITCVENLKQFSNPEEGFSELSTDLIAAALAHCQLIVVSKFMEKVKEDIDGEGVKQQLRVLCSIYALNLIRTHLGDFLATACISPNQASLANHLLTRLFSQVRPNAVALVDAFNYTDHFLGSVLGRYDGNVYPKLYEEALKDPLNESVVPEGYNEYIRPMLKQQLHNSRL